MHHVNMHPSKSKRAGVPRVLIGAIPLFANSWCKRVVKIDVEFILHIYHIFSADPGTYYSNNLALLFQWLCLHFVEGPSMVPNKNKRSAKNSPPRRFLRSLGNKDQHGVLGKMLHAGFPVCAVFQFHGRVKHGVFGRRKEAV